MKPVQHINDFAFKYGSGKNEDAVENTENFIFYLFPSVHKTKELSEEEVRTKYKAFLNNKGFYYVNKHLTIIHINFCMLCLKMMPVMNSKYEELFKIFEECLANYLEQECSEMI